MKFGEIEQQTRKIFPDWDSPALRFFPVEKGGSGRIFVRVEKERGGDSMIAMHFTNDRPDNARFASITDFLLEHGVHAPAIIERREEQGLLWVEDLGEEDLGNLAGEPWEPARRIAYESALETVFTVHKVSESDPPNYLPELENGFDSELYQWEQNYFFDHYVSNFGPDGSVSIRDDKSLSGLCEVLGGEPRFLVHRDFQCTNVMIRMGKSFLIDYQGLRWGLPEYDLASMIYDPYSEFAESEQDSLTKFYYELARRNGREEDFETFRTRLDRCAIQRLMQALGAYGFLGLVKGKEEFLQHIPTAVSRLKAIAVDRGVLPVLEKCLVEKE